MSNLSARQQREQQKAAAFALQKKGMSCRDVAQTIGTSKSSVSRWRHERVSAKRTQQRAGRQCKLSESQLLLLKKELLKGAPKQGYDTDYWSLARIAILIKRMFKVRYAKSAVWYLMDRLGWSCQKPQRVAIQRDELQIERWRRYVFPQLKKRTLLERQVDFLG
jgi:transposase